jgi:hypothetical protein
MPLADTGGSASIDKEILAAAKKRTPKAAPRPAPVSAAGNPKVTAHSNPPVANTRQTSSDSSSHHNPPVQNPRLTPSDVSAHHNPPVDNVRATPSEWNTGHHNPIPTTLYGPGREAKLERKAFKKDARQEAKAAGKTLPLGEGWRATIEEMARQLNQRKG